METPQPPREPAEKDCPFLDFTSPITYYPSDVIAHRQKSYYPCGRPRHSLPSRHKSFPERDVAAGRQTVDPIHG